MDYMIASAVADTCPTGSYSIGSAQDGSHQVCKAQPTGCAYGDSIPVDSPKCAPGSADKDPATSLPDPNRPYFDGAGNEYSATGQLLAPAPVPTTTPADGFVGK
jgi:hypothetical protein